MQAFIEFINNQSPLLVGVIVYLIMEIRGLKKEFKDQISNHIPTRINKLEADLKEDIKRIEKQGQAERQQIQDTLNRLIDHFIGKK